MGVESQNSAYWLSDAYMTSAVALFSTDKNAKAPTEAGSFKIAAQSSSMSAWEVTDTYGESVLSSSPDLQTAFTSLQNKSVNFVAADSTIGAYVAHSSGAFLIYLLLCFKTLLRMVLRLNHQIPNCNRG